MAIFYFLIVGLVLGFIIGLFYGRRAERHDRLSQGYRGVCTHLANTVHPC